MHFKKFLLALSIIFISSLSSCDIFSSTKISSSQIKKASSWSSKDQPPSFPECEGVEKKEQSKMSTKCYFKSIEISYFRY